MTDRELFIADHKDRGLHSSRYDEASDQLWQIGFRTELYMGAKVITLRWLKNGAKWHVALQLAHGTLPDLLNVLGQRAILWMEARNSSAADENQHAVKE